MYWYVQIRYLYRNVYIQHMYTVILMFIPKACMSKDHFISIMPVVMDIGAKTASSSWTHILLHRDGYQFRHFDRYEGTGNKKGWKSWPKSFMISHFDPTALPTAKVSQAGRFFIVFWWPNMDKSLPNSGRFQLKIQLKTMISLNLITT